MRVKPIKTRGDLIGIKYKLTGYHFPIKDLNAGKNQQTDHGKNQRNTLGQ